ncbi:hypothetical protein M3Y98_00814900 [Aphelenchoides besseyi]|nr:hypothetical protein M3Y98_00814000 [Aphelenchoides besseyi]KAI6181305.1 hypothetical protein M3Y98_00814900 [Aphelenchoides besseyi]KAI6212155.1 hypothetical protein M3Y96_00510400 [Aphelenchoides besseyi]KAI6212162.1 hypothetical protein M3Y96_00511100 [Aphelenchoides besseyi]
MAIRRLDFPFTVPVFPDERPTVGDYSTSSECAVKILEFLVARIDATLELDDLPEVVDGELRSARGKILVLSRNNLQTFRRLVEAAENTVQGIQDLSGFWSLVCSEMRDVQQAIERVEQHRKNKWQLPSDKSPKI